MREGDTQWGRRRRWGGNKVCFSSQQPVHIKYATGKGWALDIPSLLAAHRCICMCMCMLCLCACVCVWLRGTNKAWTRLLAEHQRKSRPLCQCITGSGKKRWWIQQCPLKLYLQQHYELPSSTHKMNATSCNLHMNPHKPTHTHCINLGTCKLLQSCTKLTAVSSTEIIIMITKAAMSSAWWWPRTQSGERKRKAWDRPDILRRGCMREWEHPEEPM